MKIAGFVAEFNPFTKGHEYLINKIKNEYGFDKLVVAMSSNFVMRGEPAIFNKMDRTKIALDYGCNLVLEIPTPFCLQAADIYASKGVEILYKAGVTDLFFGAEDNLETLEKIVEYRNTDIYKNLLNNYLKEGYSFNQSSKKALTEIDKTIENAIFQPNNLLGIEYISTIKKNDYKMNIHVVKRAESGYYDDDIEGVNLLSASALRKAILEGDTKDKFSYNISNLKPIVKNDYFEMIKYRIISSSVDELKNIFGINDGFENKIKSIKDFSSLDNIINQLISKRDRETKINRILMAILLNIKKEDLSLYNDHIRVLGFDKSGSKLLNDKNYNFISSIKRDLPIGIYRELDYSKIYYSVKENTLDMVKNEYKPIKKSF